MPVSKVLSLFALVSLFGFSSCSRTPVPSSADILIKGGEVYDGSGNESVKADVIVSGERIVYLAPSRARIDKRCKALKVIDAEGYIVCPGFIDPHDHMESDAANLESRGVEGYLRMGVTTTIFGQCGTSRLPVKDFFKKLEDQGVGVNVASFCGHGSLRSAVMGSENRFATDDEILKMKELLRDEMEQGCLGLSTGLYYTPGCFCEKKEVVELCKTAAVYDGYYTTHIRNENKENLGVYGATKEALDIGREAGIPVNISHIKCLGKSVWHQSEKVANLIESYQAEGLKVTADQYPYLASGTSMASALTPSWSREGGTKGLRRRLENPRERARIKSEIPDLLYERGGAETVFMSARAGEYTGMTLAEAAEKMGKDPVDAIISFISELKLNPYVNTFIMCDEDVEYYMKKPWVMTCTDGSFGTHPRATGSYARMIQEYVLGKKVISLGRMIRRSSGQVAETYNLQDRGFIREGAFADILVFRPEDVKANSTFEDPRQMATGFKYVIVNGEVAVEDDLYQGTRSGKILRHNKNGDVQPIIWG